VRAKGKTRPTRTFWWDREPGSEADKLRAVIFDADSVLAQLDRDWDAAARTELIDAVMSLFVAGIWVGVVSARPRAEVGTLVRHLLGDGLVETVVSIDDLSEADARRAGGGELYRLALWEMGITPRAALAVTGRGAGLRAAATAGLPAAVVDEPLSAASCQRAHRRWWIRRAA
jgi:beta-phosphoglucomutase-like phosphatase (HAD superfamily)